VFFLIALGIVCVMGMISLQRIDMCKRNPVKFRFGIRLVKYVVCITSTPRPHLIKLTERARGGQYQGRCGVVWDWHLICRDFPFESMEIWKPHQSAFAAVIRRCCIVGPFDRESMCPHSVVTSLESPTTGLEDSSNDHRSSALTLYCFVGAARRGTKTFPKYNILV